MINKINILTANNTAYIIMEFLAGKTIKDILNERKDQRLAVSDVLRLTTPILQALSKVHKRGAIHRDISPDNIMISNSGEVKLLDFGAARNVDSEEQQKLSVVLKASYAPPEQYGSTNVQNASTDIYALGAVLYRLTTGKMPEKSLERVLEDNLISPRKLNNAIPAWLDDIIMKCLQMKPEDRFQSADEFLEAIEAGRNGKSHKTTKSSPVKKAVIAAIAVVAIAIAGFAWFMSNNSEELKSSLQILEYGYQYDTVTGDINSALIVENTSDSVLKDIYLTVIAKNEAGVTIGEATDQLEYKIGPKEHTGVTCTFYEVCSETPASIEIIISEMSLSNARKEVRENGYTTPDISIVYQNGNYYECQIVNNNNYRCYGPVHMLYRDDAGNLIGGESVYAINEIEVSANSTVMAQIQVYNRLSNNCEAYAAYD